MSAATVYPEFDVDYAPGHTLTDDGCTCGSVPAGPEAAQHPAVLWHFVHTLDYKPLP